MGGAVAARPVHPECPDASAGCIEGPAQASVWGGADASIGDSAARRSRGAGNPSPPLDSGLRRNDYCAPVKALASTQGQRVAGAPQSGPPSWIPSFVGTTLLRSSKSWYGWGRCRTTRSPRVPRRFVGVYRGAPHSPVFGAGPTRVLATELRAPFDTRRSKHRHYSAGCGCPSKRPTVLDSLLRRHDPAAVVEVLVCVGPLPHDPFTPSAPTLRRGVSRGPHRPVFGVGPTPVLATVLRVVPVEPGTHPHPWIPAFAGMTIVRRSKHWRLLRVSGLRVPLKAAHPPGFPPSSARPCCGRRSPGMGGAVAARPVHPECPDASSGCIEGPRTAQCLGRGRREYWRQSCAHPSIRVGQSTGATQGQRVGSIPDSLRDRPGVRPLDNNRTGVLFYPRDNHRRRSNYPLSTTHYPLWNTPVPFCSALFHLRYDTWNTWCSIFRQSVPSPR